MDPRMGKFPQLLTPQKIYRLTGSKSYLQTPASCQTKLEWQTLRGKFPVVQFPAPV